MGEREAERIDATSAARPQATGGGMADPAGRPETGRSYEMELIVSGLTTFALLSLPGWLLEQYAARFLELPRAGAELGTVVVLLLVQLCYMLGGLFVVHLISRAYWIGLLGLSRVFPGGIDWTRTPGVGPLVRADYQARLGSLAMSIVRADRFASTLFAVIGLVGIVLAWITTLVLLAVAVVGAFAGAFVIDERIPVWLLLALAVLVMLPGMLAWLLDSVVGRRWPTLAARPGYRRCVLLLSRASAAAYPQRLVLPVQLTLLSNTRPKLYLVLAGLVMVVLSHASEAYIERHFGFEAAQDDAHVELTGAAARMRSAHYEDQRTPADRLRPYPMLPAAEQSGPFVRVFIPYQPMRDDAALARLCPQRAAADCLHELWAVELDGEAVDTAAFIPTGRADLGMRGLTGHIPLAGRPPGLRQLDFRWNPRLHDEGPALSGRLIGQPSRFVVPFIHAPAATQPE